MPDAPRPRRLARWLLLAALAAPLFRPAAPARAAASPAADPRARALRVAADAAVTVPWDTLAASGWDLRAVDPQTIRVSRAGAEVPAQVGAEGVQFIGRASASRSTAAAVYWLTYGGAPGLRAPLPPDPSDPLAWEEDRVYQPIAPTARGDRWHAAELRPGGEALEVPLPAPLAAPARLTVTVLATSLGPARAHLLGAEIGGVRAELVWESAPLTPARAQATLDAPAGASALRLSAPAGAADSILVDRVELPEVRVALPRVTAAALEPARPLPAVAGADVLIVTHADFAGELGTLAEAHRRLGQRVAVADVQAVYDAYSWGERDPEAIRAFVADSLRGWAPAPRMLLLVGAGTARLRGGPEAIVPPYLVDVDPRYGEVPCDGCYARAGADVRDTPVPAIPVGRLPVHTPEEARAAAAKAAAALLAPPPGAWRGRALVVADNDREADGAADRAGPFGPLADSLALRAAPLRAERFAYDPLSPQGGGRYPTADALRGALLPAWDSGAALVVYVGHGSPWQWAATSPSDGAPFLLGLYDADARSNGARLPILLGMTCLTGGFANPTLQSIDERLVLAPGGGVAAAVTPAGSGDNAGHRALGEALLGRLAAGAPLGEALLAGYAALAASGAARDLLYSYNLLGDPALALPPTSDVFLPLVAR